MQLKDITVKKFIEIYKILNAKHESGIDRDIKVLSCLYNESVEYYLGLTMNEFKKHSEKVAGFSLESIAPVGKKYIKANGNVYAPVYEFNRLTAGQLVDVSHFCKDATKIVDNLPLILASLCLPTKKSFKGRKLRLYGTVSHKEVAKDMESALIVDAYAIAGFFLSVWQRFLETTGDSIVKAIVANKTKNNEKITAIDKAALLDILTAFGDGIITPKK